jgi:hypothetical protein
VYFQVPKYSKLYSPEAAAELAEFESSQVYAVKDLVYKEKIDCDFHLTRAVDVCLDQEHADNVKAAFNILRDQGVKSVNDVHFMEGAAAEQVRVSPSYQIFHHMF